MSIIYVMIPLALVLVAVAVWALVWAIRSGQFDELESHGWTPVLDDDERPRPDPESAIDDRAEGAEGEQDAPRDGTSPPKRIDERSP